MAGRKKTWMRVSPRRVSPQVPDAVKRVLKEEADDIIANVLKPEHIKPPPTDNGFNYLVDIDAKWHRHYFYFCARYNCPSPNAIAPSFETKFARLEYIGAKKFNLSYMRHTEQWFELYQELPMRECLRLIAEDPHFMP
jgi:hypothetical protein